MCFSKVIFARDGLLCLTLDGEVAGQEGPLGHPLRVGRGASVARLGGLVDVLRPLTE